MGPIRPIRSSKYIIVIIFAICILAIIEGGSYLTCCFLERKGLLYNPQTITETYDDYTARLNPQLGWPSVSLFGSNDFDKTGAKVVPAFPDPDRYQACLSLYGAAFAWSGEVDATHSSSNVLSILLGCRVANYGVAGHGTDQAYLKFHDNQDDHAKIVILGISSDHIRWNVNRLRNLIIPASQFVIKPRFRLNAPGQLEKVAIPALTQKEYSDIINNPEKYLQDDFFIPEGLSGVQKFKFPYTIRVLKSFKYLIQRIVNLNNPQYVKFYQPNHPSQALPVTSTIVNNFYQEARLRGKHAIIVIVPLAPDLISYQKNNKWFYQPLIDQMINYQVEYINTGPLIIKYLGDRNPGEIYNGYHGYLNNEGHKVLAEIIFNYIESKNKNKDWQ
jgi:hypothetical protein